jgi:hypothetical protein
MLVFADQALDKDELADGLTDWEDGLFRNITEAV